MRLYRLDYLIEQMSLEKGGSVSEIRAQLEKHLNVSRPTLIRLRLATNEKPSSFSIELMRKAADFFGCKIQDLLNMPAIEQVK